MFVKNPKNLLGFHISLIDMEQKKRIISRASELFFKNGIRSVTMNDVAEALGISKRTLYENFPNKEELLEQCIDYHYHITIEKREELERQAQNPVDIMHRHFRHTVLRLNEYHPNFANELKKLHPDIWNRQILDMIKEREAYTTQLLSDGIKQGYFRKETNPAIASKLLYANVDMMSDPVAFPPDRFPRAELFRHIITGFLRSLATEKGFKEIENLFYNEKHEDYV